MSNVFVSYVEEDRQAVEVLVHGLEADGYTCWHYLRDGVPGPSYLLQTGQAIQHADAVILVLSPAALDSFQIDKEVSFAHEANRPFLPVLLGVSWGEFQQRRPAWRMAVGTAAALAAPPDAPASILPKLARGLQALGVYPAPTPTSPSPPAGAGASGESREASPSGAVVAPAWVDLPEHSPFVGRTRELEFLIEEYEAVARGRGGELIFISGEPGVGKTRLAQEVGLFAWAHGGLFLQGTFRRDATIPFAPWVEALRGGLTGQTDDQLRGLVEPYRSELAQLFPELAPAASTPTSAPPSAPAPASPPAPAPELQRLRLYDGIANLLRNLSRRTPVVLLVNDLQRAPDLSLLSHLARRLGDARALLIGTYRDQEFEERAELVAGWADLNRDRLAQTVRLLPLGEDETRRLVATHFGEDPARQLGPAIYRQTHGNPFFVEEVLRSLVETGAVRSREGGWEVAEPTQIRIPGSVKLLIEERVNRLGELAARVLGFAAIIGTEFDFPILQAVSGLAESDLIGALDAAIGARLLLDRSKIGEERYAFSDDRIQEVLYEQMTPPRRYRVHLRIAQALETVFANRLGDHLEELAHHFTEGNEIEKAADYSDRAGAMNERSFNWVRAATLYAQAGELLSHLPETDDNRRRRVDTIVKQVRVSFNIASPEQNLERLAEAEALARALPGPDGDQLRLARIHYFRGYIHRTCNEYPEAIVWYQKVLDAMPTLGELDSVDRLLLANASILIGRTVAAQGYFGKGVQVLGPAIGPLEQAGDLVELIFTLDFYGMSRVETGDYAGGLAQIQRALELAERSKNAMAQGTTRGFFGRERLVGGDLDLAVDDLTAGIQLLRQADARVYLCALHAYLAVALSRRGDSARAMAELWNYQVILREIGGQIVGGDWIAAGIAEIFLAAGQVDEARRRADDAIRLSQASKAIGGEAYARRVWGQTLAGESPPRLKEAEAHFTASVELFEQGDAHLEAAFTHLIWGLTRHANNDSAGARDLLTRAASQFETSGATRLLETARQHLGELT